MTTPPSEQVIVLTASLFNGPDHKSIGWCEVGDIIEIAGGFYVESLINDGFVAYLDEVIPEETIEDLEDLDAKIAAVEGIPPVVEEKSARKPRSGKK